MAVFGVLPEVLKRPLQIAVQYHGGLRAHVVEHSGGVVKKQRQVILNARRGNPIAHVFVDATLGGVTVHEFTPAVAKACAGIVVHRELAPREQPHFRHGVEAALRIGVKGADGVDFVIKQIHAKWLRAAHGKEVDERAAHGKLPGANHLGDVAIACQRQLPFELGLVELLPGFELKRISRHKTRRCQAVQRGGGGDDDHVRTRIFFALADAPQGGQALANQILVRRKAVVRQRFPVGEQGTAQAGREKSNLVEQTLGIGGIGGNHRQGQTSGLFPLTQAGE